MDSKNILPILRGYNCIRFGRLGKGEAQSCDYAGSVDAVLKVIHDF